MLLQILTHSLAVLLAAVAVFLFSSCRPIGKSKVTLIKHQISDADKEALSLFPQYLTTKEDARVIRIDRNAEGDIKRFHTFMESRYGSNTAEPAHLALTVRDRTKTPPFLPIDVESSKLIDFYLKDEGRSVMSLMALEKLMYARLYNVPDLVKRTTLHHYQIDDKGERKVFYTYPRLTIDVSASLSTQRLADRFSYLGLAIVLDPEASGKRNENGDRVRFLDFSPKAADLVEYTRGTLTQAASLNAKATVGQSIETASGGEQTGSDQKSITSRKGTDSIGGELAYMLSDTYVNELRDAFERRTAGLFREGGIFRAEFRAIDDKRLGGTYSFDVMLEIPANVKGADERYESHPLVEELRATVYLVGVVRHVHKSGRTGTFVKVPEPSNDHVYEQVILVREQVMLWKYNQHHWGSEVLMQGKPQYTVSVRTNHDQARFVVRDVNSNELLGAGAGVSAEVSFPTGDEEITAQVEFLDIVLSLGSTVHRLNAEKSPTFTVPKNQAGSSIQVGVYQ